VLREVKTIMRFLLALVLAVSWLWSASAEERVLPSTISIDGITYEDVQWDNVTKTTVTLRHKTGVATIPLSKLPTELQQHFGFDPQKMEQARQSVKAEQRQKAVPTIVEAPASTTKTEVRITGAFGVALGASLSRLNVIGKKTTSYDPNKAYEYQFQFQPSQPSQLIEEYYVWVTPKTKKVYCIEGVGKWDAGLDDTVKNQRKALFELLSKRYGHVTERKPSGFWDSLFSSDDQEIKIDKRRIVVGSAGGIFKGDSGRSVSLIRMQVKYLDDDLETLFAKENEELESEQKRREEKDQADEVKRKFNPSGF